VVADVQMTLTPIAPIVSERLKSLALGDHLCLFYDGLEQQIAIAIDYLARGLFRGERCLYVADEHTLDAMRQGLLAAKIDVDIETERGALVLMSKDQAYLDGGRFDVDRMIAMLKTAVERTLHAGFKGLRAAGDMTWVLDNAPGSDKAIVYEAMMTQFFSGAPALGLCLYSRGQLDPLTLEGALRTHPVALTGDACCDPNPFFESLDIFLQQLEPRERFEWKLRRLCTLARQKSPRPHLVAVPSPG
jgi:hypothetical protein